MSVQSAGDIVHCHFEESEYGGIVQVSDTSCRAGDEMLASGTSTFESSVTMGTICSLVIAMPSATARTERHDVSRGHLWCVLQRWDWKRLEHPRSR